MFFRWLKRYMPRGLYGRALLILVLPVVSLQLILSVVFIQRHFEGVTSQMTSAVLIELNYLQSQVAGARSLGEAQENLTRVARALDFVAVLPAQDIPQNDQKSLIDLTGPFLIRSLQAGLPNLLAVNLPDANLVELWLDTDQGVLKLSFSRRRVSATNPHQLIVITAAWGALMTLISYFFLRNQLRPIQRMAHAATEYGKGRIVPYAPSGATEVRAAGAAFLDMRARIERQTQSRTMMLSGVSHDLRTPLTRLRLGLSLLDEEESAPLLQDVEEMQRLTDAFLDFARGDAGDDAEMVDPVALTREVVAGFAVTGGRVTMTEPEDMAPVSLRPLSIRRALENLIGNALRYGNRAEVSLCLSEKALRFTVEDDGPGIPAHLHDEAMRPFSRLDPARNQDQGSGVGLGLAIVSDIARGHGGVLRLGESTELGGLRADLVIAR